MSYATSADVLALVQAAYPNGFDTGSAPTTTQMAILIPQIAAEIDAHLSPAGYTIPVTTPASFLTWLSLVNAEGVAALALKSLAPGTTQSSNGGPVIPAYAYFEKRYQDALKAIDDGRVDFAGADLGNSILPSSYLTANPNNGGLDGSDGLEGVRWGQGQQPPFSMQQVF